MIVIQEKRKIAKNPHINFSVGGFRPGTGTKTLYEKIQDLIKDPFYPENEFNRLKLYVILSENIKEEAEKKLQEKRDLERELQITREELRKVTKENEKATNKIKEMKEEIQKTGKRNRRTG